MLKRNLTREERARFWSHVKQGKGYCWEWQHVKNHDGYGVFSCAGIGIKRSNGHQAHRLSWAIMRGLPPPGKMVLHKCHNRACVNPDHLYIGTQADNMADMAKAGRSFHKNKTTCKRGHAFVPETTYRYTDPNGIVHRICRICQRERVRKCRERKQA